MFQTIHFWHQSVKFRAWKRFTKLFVLLVEMVRCIIVEEGAYQNRSARNRVQIVSMVPQSWQFRGTKNGLFALSSQHCRDGVPYVYARDFGLHL